MQLFSMIFAILMIATAIGAAVLVGMFAGSIWASLGVALLLCAAYRGVTYVSGAQKKMRPQQLNAFQQPLADKKDKA